eukprot:XP_011682135.1 PREDICTED: putative DMBT1-like protein [Strongylocentrotus purpuratus]
MYCPVDIDTTLIYCSAPPLGHRPVDTTRPSQVCIFTTVYLPLYCLRLIGGTNDAEGRVEILHDGSWGTVCDDSWDLKDAEVVCKMLSFEGALDAPLGARFGKGSGSIFLDEVQCHEDRN